MKIASTVLTALRKVIIIQERDVLVYVKTGARVCKKQTVRPCGKSAFVVGQSRNKRSAGS